MLTKELKDQGYDLINGPLRNHKLLQLWIKKAFNEAELLFPSIQDTFNSDVELHVEENPALNVDSTKKNEYEFNIGLTVLDDILSSIGIGSIGLNSEIKSGKKLSISYNNSFSKEVPIGELYNYFSVADFKYPNPTLLKNLNRDNVLIITGVIYAKNLVIDIETHSNIEAGIEANIKEIVDGKLSVDITNEKKIQMVSTQNKPFPIAVKVSRIDYDRNKFKELKQVSDNRDFF